MSGLLQRERLTLNARVSSAEAFAESASPAHRLQVYRDPSCGRFLPYNRKPALLHPLIGQTYNCRVADIRNAAVLCERPLILIGYYTQGKEVVACDFIDPRTGAPGDNFLDSEFFNFEIQNFRYAKRGANVFKDMRISCSNLIQLPNNPEDICSKGSVSSDFIEYLPDYLLRRAMTFYEGRASCKKDAIIPMGSVRHGFSFDAMDRSLFNKPNTCTPDLSDPTHNFSQGDAGRAPAFAIDAMEKAIAWARKAREMEVVFGRLPSLPPLRSVKDWGQPPIPSGRHKGSYACDAGMA